MCKAQCTSIQPKMTWNSMMNRMIRRSRKSSKLPKEPAKVV
jgi:hypothetical protein